LRNGRLKKEKGSNKSKKRKLLKLMLVIAFAIFAFGVVIISQIKPEPSLKKEVSSPALDALQEEMKQLGGYELGRKMFEYELARAKLLGVSEENLPFLIEGSNESRPGRKGVLLLHGFGASPWEVKELGDYLAEKGITVYAPLLEGHGTKGEDMKSVRWEDWYASAEYGYDALSKMADEVYVAGLSMGGDLSIILASKHDFDGLITINAPITLIDKRARLVWAFKYVRSEYKRDVAEDEKAYYYETIPADAVFELMVLIRETQRALPKVTEKMMIIQALDDETADPSSADYIENNAASEDKKVYWYQKGHHVIIKEEEREAVFKSIYGMVAGDLNN
jgi:carboxylesterase